MTELFTQAPFKNEERELNNKIGCNKMITGKQVQIR